MMFNKIFQGRIHTEAYCGKDSTACHTMTEPVSGIHHITCYASDPQENIDFYTDLLGLRLVKQTVLFSNPVEVFEGEPIYHLYYGNTTGAPGTAITFKPPGTDATRGTIADGEVGRGQASATAYTVPDGSLGYWQERLENHDVNVYGPKERFGDRLLQFRDHDGLPVELFEGTSDVEPWTEGGVPEEYAIRGFYGATLRPHNALETGKALEAIGLVEVGQQSTPQRGDWTRYVAPGAERAKYIDLYNTPNFHEGSWGYGTVHHVALRVPNEQALSTVRERLRGEGYSVTTTKDRKYFTSMYFRDPSGINIEVATEPPGFTVDESPDNLGRELQLPDYLEDQRAELEERLIDIET
jgi:glyoxalase family protein